MYKRNNLGHIGKAFSIMKDQKVAFGRNTHYLKKKKKRIDLE